MSDHPSRRDDAILAAAALTLGLLGALAYAAWAAVSADESSGRWGEFGDAMVFPGLVIAAAVAAMVWLGWKANID